VENRVGLNAIQDLPVGDNSRTAQSGKSISVSHHPHNLTTLQKQSPDPQVQQALNRPFNDPASRLLVSAEAPEKWVLETSLSFGSVDRDHLITLSGIFKLLQEAAIAHANQYDTGTDAMITRGESWVLNRMATEIIRYPHYGERLRVETWSSGIRGFKGYRDFRIFDVSGNLVITASSLWLYVNMQTHSIIRVPREIAAHFPCSNQERYCPDLEALHLPIPTPDTAAKTTISLRYSDIDANAHVNNTSYLDFLQTTLAEASYSPRPTQVQIKYGKGISVGTASVTVHLAHSPDSSSMQAFSILAGNEMSAQGTVG
jgi:medium-chain acyl-[acyl-carrier-protein] hydrolase